jgi:hypothetical protein
MRRLLPGLMLTCLLSFSSDKPGLKPGHYSWMVSLGHHAGIRSLVLKKNHTYTYDVKVTSLSHEIFKGKWHITNDTLHLVPTLAKVNLSRSPQKITCPCNNENEKQFCDTEYLFIRNDTLFSWKDEDGNPGGEFTFGK